ncbi:MAG: cold shock domain-containing protein [Candidatus Gracilibacteria bacterium]|nr:cold shock domain-containing protein [Candidatus Gracilibacteria bacterium]
MYNGKVKFFNDTKGFGFIIDNESSQEYFVHISGVNGQIKEGDEVQYEVEQGKRGLNAVNVQVI